MKFHIDINTRRFVRSAAAAIPLETLFFKRRDAFEVEVVFVDRTGIVPTPAGTSFLAGIKSSFGGDFLAFTNAAGVLNLHTTGVEALFADEPEKVSAYFEIKSTTIGEETRTHTLQVDLQNAVILGDEGVPADSPSLKASQAEAQAGISNDKWMTPLRTAEAIAALSTGGGSSDWNSITGKPATFPPDFHTHPISQISFNGGGGIPSNTAIGSGSLEQNTTGIQNTAIGPNALQKSNGSQNTAIGAALKNNQTGSQNTAIGHDALAALVTGDNNTAIGISTLLQFQSGSFLTAIGSGALAYLVSGNANTAIGNGAMLGLNGTTRSNSNNTAVGDASQLKIDTGSGNSSLGAFSLINNTTGSQNTALGNGALVDNVDHNNTTGLGYNAVVTGSNQVQLGNSTTTVYAYGSIQDRSDARDKTDIRDTALGLDFITALRPVDFRWDMREDYRTPAPVAPPIDATPEQISLHEQAMAEWLQNNKLANIAHDGTHRRHRYHHGLIAQEVREVLEERGIDFGGFQDHSLRGGDDVLSIGYLELIAPLIKAVKELSAKVAALEAAS